jgi:hypothetical protein
VLDSLLEVARLSGGYADLAEFQAEMKRTIRYVRQHVEQARPLIHTLKQADSLHSRHSYFVNHRWSVENRL